MTGAALPVSARLLAGEVAVVGHGNGLAIALGLAQAGAAVALLDIDETSAVAACAAIIGEGGHAMAARLDVGDRAGCVAVADAIEGALGPASILVANAGILHLDPVGSNDFEDNWDEILRINVTGTMAIVRAVHPQLRRTRGRIVTVGSIASFLGSLQAAAYAASKGAVLQLTRALAVELAPDGIRVNGIAPGRLATRMTESFRDHPAGKAAYLARTPLGRYGAPGDLVGPVLFLCSSWSAYVTGVMLPVDGGYLVG